MGASDLVRYLTEVPFVLIFLATALEAARRPRRVAFDVALFFGAAAAIVAIVWWQRALGLEVSGGLSKLAAVLLITLPYLQLRMVDDTAGAPVPVKRAAEAGLVALALVLLVLDPPYTVPATEGLVAYFVAVQGYVAFRVVRAARGSQGINRRRLTLAAAGMASLGVMLVLAGLGAAWPGRNDVWTAGTQLAALGSGVSFALSFATPRSLRVAWQAPEFRSFVRNSAEFAGTGDLHELARRIEAAVADATGAPHAALLLWDDEHRALYAPSRDRYTDPARRGIVDRVFVRGRAELMDHVAAGAVDFADTADPQHAGTTRAFLGTPLISDGRVIGVLAVYGPRPWVFAGDDLEFLDLLASQTALVIKSHRLLQESAEVRAQAEATRLKDDFLSAAAHDLKTPLTTLIGRAQLMERRARRSPGQPADLAGLQEMVEEGRRLSRLVTNLLDASRSERTGFVGERTPTPIEDVTREVLATFTPPYHRFEVHANEEAVVLADRERIVQVLRNLVDNAVKYSPSGGLVSINAHPEADMVRLTVCDQGLGIPREDLPYIFERFQRGRRADDRRFAGMGIGLFLCKQIVEEHGGRIWAESTEGKGSCFNVLLPRCREVRA